MRPRARNRRWPSATGSCRKARPPRARRATRSGRARAQRAVLFSGAAAQGVSAALQPLRGGDAFGTHVDNAIRLLRGTDFRVRSDLSATLFLEEPEHYDGGELCVEDTYGVHRAKLPAGDMVLYPASSLHHVTPVTRGARGVVLLDPEHGARRRGPHAALSARYADSAVDRRKRRTRRERDRVDRDLSQSVEAVGGCVTAA